MRHVFLRVRARYGLQKFAVPYLIVGCIPLNQFLDGVSRKASRHDVAAEEVFLARDYCDSWKIFLRRNR